MERADEFEAAAAVLVPGDRRRPGLEPGQGQPEPRAEAERPARREAAAMGGNVDQLDRHGRALELARGRAGGGGPALGGAAGDSAGRKGGAGIELGKHAHRALNSGYCVCFPACPF